LAQVLVGGLSAGLGVACARSGVSKSALAETVVAQSDHAGAPAPDCREREQAHALSDAGDTLVKRDVTRAIDSYTRAIRVYPKDHRLFWKLALALLRQEDWRRAEVALTRAVELGPSFANYWFQLGNVLVMQAEEGDASAFERAKVPLKRCIEVDPNFAECHHLLGEAHEQTDDERSALLEYSRAIELDPAPGYFYGPLADVYLDLGLWPQAKSVLEEGARLIPDAEKHRFSLYNVYVLRSKLARFEHDRAGELKALASAEAHVSDERLEEQLFNLGSTYASMDPPEEQRAARLLNSFRKRACRDATPGRALEGQCGYVESVLRKLSRP